MRKRRYTDNRRLGRGLEILYEDEDILVADKPAGLLTIGTGVERTKTAYYILTDYVRKGCAKSRKRIFIVHRLDRETSGVVVFAKNVEAKMRLQSQWGEAEKRYLAVVYGRWAEKEGIISSYLAENSAHVVYTTTEARGGKLAQTAYKVLKETKELSLLEIRLLTGRKNQIRVQTAYAGHPVVGDRKYGKKDDQFRRLALHSKTITFGHPVSGERLTFESETPGYFKALLGGGAGRKGT
jgi:tRNA pseudouridine32 synthase/23S rRNA pseudouridine746 synthase/23S rRNA pseudouridine1911/1915/1917 synthase